MDASGGGARDGRERRGSARWTRAVGKRAMDASSGGSARWNASGARSQERNQEQKQTLFDGKPKGRPTGVAWRTPVGSARASSNIKLERRLGGGVASLPSSRLIPE